MKTADKAFLQLFRHLFHEPQRWIRWQISSGELTFQKMMSDSQCWATPEHSPRPLRESYSVAATSEAMSSQDHFGAPHRWGPQSPWGQPQLPATGPMVHPQAPRPKQVSPHFSWKLENVFAVGFFVMNHITFSTWFQFLFLTGMQLTENINT